jgi:hypothetical protein
MVRGPAIRWGAVTGRLELLSSSSVETGARGILASGGTHASAREACAGVDRRRRDGLARPRTGTRVDPRGG